MQKLFEERCAGNLSDAVFKKLMHDYETEQAELNERLHDMKQRLAVCESQGKNTRDFAQRLAKYATIDRLTREVVTELIDSILVSESYAKNGVKHQDITINYKFVGSINQTNL
jgi:hypothetical protein